MPLPPPTLAIDQIHLRLFAIRRTAIDARSWTLRSMQDSFWRFYMNATDGAALELVGEDGAVNVQYELAAQRLYFVPAGVRFNTSTRLPIEHFYVHLDILGVPQAAMQALFGGPVCVPSHEYLQQEARALAVDVSNEARPGLLTQCRVKSLLYGALAAYLSQLPAALHERYQQLAQAQAPIQPALQEIEGRLEARLSNGYLAGLCHLSEDYFIRLFRASVGQSPIQYIQAQRVRRAAQRLLFSAESIEAIAASTGFGNRFYFSRVFTRHLGVAPASYRRMARV
ncbi:MAG: helix-turn-helix transcriptional regulator [Roseiflexaceae bacterium]|nr:helix-turn-helix transcriptional regulator [Roseiflexaceae bacterium]